MPMAAAGEEAGEG